VVGQHAAIGLPLQPLAVDQRPIEVEAHPPDHTVPAHNARAARDREPRSLAVLGARAPLVCSVPPLAAGARGTRGLARRGPRSRPRPSSGAPVPATSAAPAPPAAARHPHCASSLTLALQPGPRLRLGPALYIVQLCSDAYSSRHLR